MNKEKKESAMKVSVWSLWRIVGAGFACSGEWVSRALYFWSLTAIWIREPVVPGKEQPTLSSCWRSPTQGHWVNPIPYHSNAHTRTHTCAVVPTVQDGSGTLHQSREAQQTVYSVSSALKHSTIALRLSQDMPQIICDHGNMEIIKAAESKEHARYI